MVLCAKSCWATSGCKQFSVTKLTDDGKNVCELYQTDTCTCKANSKKGTSNHKITTGNSNQGFGIPDKWIITDPSRTEKQSGGNEDSFWLPIDFGDKLQLRTTNQYCPLWRYEKQGTDHPKIRLSGSHYQKLFVKSNVVEPKTWSF